VISSIAKLLCNIDGCGIKLVLQGQGSCRRWVPSAPLYMAGTQPESNVVSDRSDDLDLSFDVDLNIDAVEYSRIMRRIFVNGDDGAVTSVSAFNSSI
jgi:hypothetical protein